MKRLRKIVQQTVVYELRDRLVPGGGGEVGGGLGRQGWGHSGPILGSHWEARQL